MVWLIGCLAHLFVVVVLFVCLFVSFVCFQSLSLSFNLPIFLSILQYLFDILIIIQVTKCDNLLVDRILLFFMVYLYVIKKIDQDDKLGNLVS